MTFQQYTDNIAACRLNVYIDQTILNYNRTKLYLKMKLLFKLTQDDLNLNDMNLFTEDGKKCHRRSDLSDLLSAHAFHICNAVLILFT